jgi:type III pantothenate kinase
MRFKALHRFAARLPLGSTLQKYSTPGKNTLEAISAGVTNGLIYEINSYIRSFREDNIDSMIILTGGDSGYLKDRLYAREISARLVLDG